MIRIGLRMFARGSSALVASALLALGASGAGCAAEASTTPPTYVEGATVASGPGTADAEVVYVQDPPVVDIETYPTVVYEGAPVYFVGGEWYRRDSHGWAYFRREPAELGRQRESHDRDPQWQRAREAPRHDQVQAARPEVTRPEQVARPQQEVGRPAEVARPQQAVGHPAEVARPQQPEQVARPEGARPEQVAPQARPAERNAAPAVATPAKKEEETTAPGAPKRGRGPVKRPPGAPPPPR